MPADHPLLAKLARVMILSEAEATAIRNVSVQPAVVPADKVIAREGDQPSKSFLLAEGVACISKVVGSGRRQIMALQIGGDMPDLHGLHLRVLDSDLWAITDCRLAYMPHADLRRLCRGHPRVAEELWRNTLVDAAIYREWVANLGQRDAVGRLTHLFCELMLRMEAAGLARDGSCPLPITQGDLSEATGMSLVHVNRTIQDLRTQNLISFERGRLSIHNWKALVELADFRPDYLHLPVASPVPAA